MAQKKSPSDPPPRAKRKRAQGSPGTTVGEGSTSSPKKASKKETNTKSPATEFPPILSDLDLHLFGEGKHYRIYEKLGAHVTSQGGTRGVAFAVWAPAADRVSLVGNFNSWDVTKHPMRRLEIGRASCRERV